MNNSEHDNGAQSRKFLNNVGASLAALFPSFIRRVIVSNNFQNDYDPLMDTAILQSYIPWCIFRQLSRESHGVCVLNPENDDKMLKWYRIEQRRCNEIKIMSK